MPPQSKKAAEVEQQGSLRTNKLATPEQIEEGAAAVRAAVAASPAVEVRAMFDLEVRVVSATIVEDEIRAMVVCTGTVLRPEAEATAVGKTFEIRIPAKVERDGTA